MIKNQQCKTVVPSGGQTMERAGAPPNQSYMKKKKTGITLITYVVHIQSKKFQNILSPIPSVLLSPCQCHLFSKPWQGADCHLPPLMQVDLPTAAFHLTVGILTGRVLCIEVAAISPHHLALFWAVTKWTVYTSLFCMNIYPLYLGFPAWWYQAVPRSGQSLHFFLNWNYYWWLIINN